MPVRTPPALVVILAAAAVAAIAAIASVATRLRTVERAEQEARGDPVLLRLDPYRATAIRIAADGGELRLERAPAGWHLVAPVHADADPAAVAGLLDEMSALVRRATVAPPGEPAQRLQPYGLDAPRTWIEVSMEDGRVERLALGGDTGADGASFVMATGGDVAMVSSAARAGLEKRLADLEALAPRRAGPDGAPVPPLRARAPRRGG